MISSVLKAIDILQLFSTGEAQLSLTEISRRLNLPKSTTHNLLNTMLSRRLIEKTEEGQYALGTEIIALTQSVRINVELRDVAAPLLRELADVYRESVYLTVLEETSGLYIYAIESPRRLQARTAVGDRAHLHCTAVGKAMLSRLPEERVRAIMATAGMPKFTERTITDLDALLATLQDVRAQGYAVDDAEHEEGTYCISAPIINRQGWPIAACSLASGTRTVLESNHTEVAAQVVRTAQQISRYMGYVPSRSSAFAPRPKIDGVGVDKA